jgi:RNA recognition motif-containing protein
MRAGLKGEPKEKRLIFIGGLSTTMTEQVVLRHFEQYCEVESVKFMTDKRSGQSKGYGFVRLASSSMIEPVLNQTHVIAGRRIDCQKAAKKADKKKLREDVLRRKLFISGLPCTLTSEQLELSFSRFGKIRACYIIKDEQSMAFKNYGFIEFEEEAAAKRVMTLKLAYRGHPIACSWYKNRFGMNLPTHSQRQDHSSSDVVDLASSEDPASSSESSKKQNTAKLKHEGPNPDSPIDANRDLESCEHVGYEFLKLSKFINESPANYRFRVSTTAATKPCFAPKSESISSRQSRQSQTVLTKSNFSKEPIRFLPCLTNNANLEAKSPADSDAEDQSPLPATPRGVDSVLAALGL